jgi:hypothetical protein
MVMWFNLPFRDSIVFVVIVLELTMSSMEDDQVMNLWVGREMRSLLVSRSHPRIFFDSSKVASTDNFDRETKSF